MMFHCVHLPLFVFFFFFLLSSAPRCPNGSIARWSRWWRTWKSTFLSRTRESSVAWPHTWETFQMSSSSTLPMKYLRTSDLKPNYNSNVCTLRSELRLNSVRSQILHEHRRSGQEGERVPRQEPWLPALGSEESDDGRNIHQEWRGTARTHST